VSKAGILSGVLAVWELVWAALVVRKWPDASLLPSTAGGLLVGAVGWQKGHTVLAG
jgi:hypothetical protein